MTEKILMSVPHTHNCKIKISLVACKIAQGELHENWFRVKRKKPQKDSTAKAIKLNNVTIRRLLKLGQFQQFSVAQFSFCYYIFCKN